MTNSATFGSCTTTRSKWLEPDFQKIQRQIVGQAIEFAVGDGAVAVDERDSLFYFSKAMLNSCASDLSRQ